MYAAGRIASLRIAALAGLAASAALTHDTLHPDRAFCPLEQACDRARSSPLGVIFGIPTSLVGVIAFGAFLLLTLLPVEAAWRLVRWAGIAAATAGIAFLAYQHFVLGTYCPLCLVADGAGILAGFLAVTWRRPPVYRSGKRLEMEPRGAQAAWLTAMALAAAVPFLWPRAEEPSWVEIEPPADLVAEGPDAEAMTTTADLGTPPHAPTPVPASPTGPDSAVPEPVAPVPEATLPSPAAPTPSSPSPAPPDTPVPAQAPRPPPRAPTSRPEVGPPSVVIVEYLNAYCAHCRATHRRLDKVVAEGTVPVRRRRVLTWAGGDIPLWARAVAYAETRGLGEAMFSELMDARGESAPEVYAAARRAGVDLAGLEAALRDPTPPQRLVRDRQLAASAGLRGLPTLDIGRRRLMGEQSEAELREAIRAAAAPRARPATRQ